MDGARIRLNIDEHVIVDDAIPSRGGRRDFLLTEELYSIPWGDERFLVPAELMPEFCALATAEGWDSMKYADYPANSPPASRHSRALVGLPSVPAEFRPYLPR